MPARLNLRNWFLGGVLLFVGLAVIAVFAVVSYYLIVNETNGRVTSSGQVRKYLVYEPASYDPARPAPLVISFHGFAEWPAHQMQISHWNDLADEFGFIVVYPSGTRIPLQWKAYNLPETRVDTSSDVQFIADLIEKLARDYNIDASRVYANGLSNGGGMSVLLSCQLSARIAAVGTVAGAYLLPWDQCVQTRPVPIIAFHGTEDPIVAYRGGEVLGSGLFFPDIPEWIGQWAERNGCNSVALELPPRGEVSGLQYTGCDQNADVVLYTVRGGGHSWPGGEELPELLVGHTTQDIDATRVMWEFFSKHSL